VHRIVVVGGGIAGIVSATHLSRRLTPGKTAEILLIDHNRAHVWKPMLHTFAAGTANYTNENISFVTQARRSGFKYWPGELAGLNRSRKLVALGPVPLPDATATLPGRSIPYDTLILAVGSRANDFGTPGVAENCQFIDNIGEANAFNNLLRSRTFQAIDAHTDLHVVIVGGGATGVELCAELARRIEILSSYADAARQTRLRLTLIETGPRLLGPFPEHISTAVEAKLREIGVDVRTRTKVVGSDKDGVVLDGGQRIDAALIAWAAGVKAPEVLSKLDGLDVSRNGQILVRPTLQSQQDDSVFALGDCSNLPGRDGKSLPTTAQVARQQAVFLARSLARHLGQNRPLAEFHFRDMGSIVSLADYAAYGTLGSYGFFRGGFLKGRFAQVAHAALYRMHQMDLYGPVRGGVIWLADDLTRAVSPRVDLS
jgi:NADH:ubiquinone reductase (H+-translocating)